jgi:hypothetical protein
MRRENTSTMTNTTSAVHFFLLYSSYSFQLHEGVSALEEGVMMTSY